MKFFCTRCTGLTLKVSKLKVLAFANSVDQDEKTHLDQHCLPSSLCIQGPVVQSIVSLMSSLTGQLVRCFMTL